MLSYVDGVSVLLVDEFNRIRNRGSAGLHGIPFRSALYAVSRRCLHQFRASADSLAGAVAAALMRDLKYHLIKPAAPLEVDVAASAPGKKRQRGQQNTSSSNAAEPIRSSTPENSFLEINTTILTSALQSTLPRRHLHSARSPS